MRERCASIAFILLFLFSTLTGGCRRPETQEEFNERQMHGHGTTPPHLLRGLLTSQIQYRAYYPEVGYACSLATLGGMGESAQNREPDARHAMLIDPRLASGHESGYTLNISNCHGRPVSKFSVIAVPDSPAAGQIAYCADQSSVIHYSMDGKGETCLASGKVLR